LKVSHASIVIATGLCLGASGAGFGSLAMPIIAQLVLPLAPAGVWRGVRMARTIGPLWFYRILYGIKLLWDGLTWMLLK